MSDTQGNNNNNAKGKSVGVAKATPSLDPRLPSLVQPFKRLVEEGFITELTVSFTPMGASSVCKIDKRVVEADSNFALGTNYPVGLIARLADEKNLIPKKGKKSGVPVAQALPKKSLVPEDFKSDAGLLARAQAVATGIGAGGILGRIGSGGMLPPETMKFADWWKNASPEWRLKLLTTKEKRELISKEIDPALSDARVRSLGCPFRDILEIRVAVVEDDEEEEEGETEEKVPTPPSTSKGRGSAASGQA